jgi:hypothetical protein
MLKHIAAALLAAIAATGIILVARAAPDPRAAVSWPLPTAAKAPICKSSEIVDARPDPAWVGASFAGDNCRAPPIPAVVNGFTASREQVMASIAAMKSYTAAADAFQRCVQDFVANRQADQNKKRLSTPLVIIENHRVLASENNKKKVADQVKSTIIAFNEYGSGCAE